MNAERNVAGRLPWIDFLRGLAMIFVVYWHCSSLSVFNTITGGFYMPMFYALSGYLFNNDGGLRIGKLFKKIYLPLLVIGVLPSILGPLFRMQMNAVLSRSFYFLTSWFLPTFFASTVIFRLLVVYVKDNFLSTLISLFIMFSGFILTKYSWAADYYTTNICLSTILVGQFFIMLGFMWKKHEDSHIINIKIYKIISFVSLCVFLTLGFITEPGRMIDFHTNTYPNLSIGMGVILSSLLLGYSCTRYMTLEVVWLSPLIKAVSYIGKYAIYVFLLHHYIIAFLNRKVLNTIYPQVKQDPINALVYTTLTLVVCFIIISLIRKFVPSFLGEKR